jgi:hypothetical protein
MTRGLNVQPSDDSTEDIVIPETTGCSEGPLPPTGLNGQSMMQCPSPEEMRIRWSEASRMGHVYISMRIAIRR